MVPLAQFGIGAGRRLIDMLRAHELQWFPDIGLGFYPVPPDPRTYNAAYFKRYASYRGTRMDARLNQLRCKLVRRYWPGPVVDVGIGSGSFIEAHGNARGYDINPAGYEWLRTRDLVHNPWIRPASAVTMWDVIEHIENFADLLAHVRDYVFLSLPIFESAEHVLRSKHFRRDEHCWYFTEAGLIFVMTGLGWALLEVNDLETQAGREDIRSFAFKRET